MDDLNFETVGRLRAAFNLMTESRRHLRPILSDIAANIDKGFFIDAGSEEVTELLQKILYAQEQFSEVEHVKRAAATKRIDQVEKAVNNLEQNLKREELNNLLARITTLEVDSDNDDIIESLKKVKLQAERIRHKSGKMDISEFEKSSGKFLLLTEVVDSGKCSPGDYVKLNSAFSDNPLITMAVSLNLLHFPRPVVEEVVEVENVVEEKPEVEKIVEREPEVPSKHRLTAIVKKFDAIKPNVDLVENDENSFVIEKAQIKKQLSIKSFNKKLRELIDSTDPMPLMKILIKTKIFFKDQPKDLNILERLPKKIRLFAPTILERFFNWGLVDKITWREREFYFLNAQGLDICVRSFTRINTPADNGYFQTMSTSLQLYMMFHAEPRIKNGYNIEFGHNTTLPVTRGFMKINNGTTQVILMIALSLLGKNWQNTLAKYKLLIEHEIRSGAELKAIFLFAYTKEDLAWIKMFETSKFRYVKVFMYTLDGLFDQDENLVSFGEWGKICRFGAIARGRKKSSSATVQDNDDDDDDEPDDNSPSPTNNNSDDENIVESETAVVEQEFTETVEVEKIEDDFTPIYVEKNIPAPVEITEEEITEVEETKKNDSLANIENLFKAGANARGMLSLHALRDFFTQNDLDGEIWADYFTREIGFILDDPVTLKTLHNFDTFSFWASEIEIPDTNMGTTFDWLNLAAMIKNFYAPQNPTSYQIQKTWRQINEDKSNSALKICPAAKTLLSLFNNFTEKTHRAFADCLTTADDNNEEKFQLALQQIKNAEEMADSVLHSDVNHKVVKSLIQQIFNYNGLIRRRLYVDNFKDDEILNFCRDFEDTDLTAVLAENNPAISEELFSENKIGDYLDDIWEKPLVHLVHGKNEPFKGPKRSKVISVMKQILIALFNYVYAKKHLELAAKSNIQAAPANKALEIISDLKKQLARVEKKANLGQIIFRSFIDNIERKLRGENVNFSYRECLLTSKYIELEDDLPVINSFGIADFSLKNRVADYENELRYKKLDENLQKAYESALKNYDCGILQNLAKNYLAQLTISEEDLNRKISALDKQVDKQIERIYNDFLNDLELARNYSRITDQERIDFYINAALEAKEHFLQTKNAGLFQRFIYACTASINKVSIPQRNALTKRLEKLRENLEPTLSDGENLNSRYPILENIRKQIEQMNLTVAEDYMNRLETEGGNLLTELDVSDSNLSTLEDFLSEYEVLLRAVNAANGSVEGAFKSRLNLHGNRPNRETQNAIDFTHGWQGINSGHDAAIETAVIEILNHLGYDGGKISAQNINSLNQKSYTITFNEPIKARESYPHPFAVFGTEIFTKGLEIIYLGSSRKYDNIAQVLTGMTADRGTICFMNNAMTLPERRNLAKIMKITPNLKNIIVIDKVMALYLARFDDANRGKKMLQTALPFARVQPYTAGGFVAPEMFIGRSEELDQIRDMSGPVFVYGGRQLGKSALLRQVKSIENNPAQLNYAFFIDLKNLDSERTLKKIVYELQNAKLIGEVQTWQDFSMEMHKLLDGKLRGVYKPNKLLLLMDESDTFLSGKDSEIAIDILRELLVAFNGQFKFVLAGLHKVIRFEQNSSFGNLNHISVLPFKPADAMELLVKPMSYLGFRIVDDSLISAIFSRTNYYPGSIQYYCKMLVDAVGNNYAKQKFDVSKNPPYTLDDDYLKNMLGNREFQEEINQKFQITLHLDDDNYYEILALAVAMSYYEANRPVGVDLTSIKNNCLMCGVDKITKLSDVELTSLLDEMVALNLLRRTEGKFEFNRYAFWHMMGTESEVNAKMDSYGLKKAE